MGHEATVSGLVSIDGRLPVNGIGRSPGGPVDHRTARRDATSSYDLTTLNGELAAP